MKTLTFYVYFNDFLSEEHYFTQKAQAESGARNFCDSQLEHAPEGSEYTAQIEKVEVACGGKKDILDILNGRNFIVSRKTVSTITVKKGKK